MNSGKQTVSDGLVIAILILTIIVSGILFFGWQWTKNTNADTHAEATITKIEEIYSPNKDDGRRFDITAEYIVEGKTYILNDAYVNKSGKEIGDKIKILYNHNNPSEYYIGDDPANAQGVIFWLFIISLLLPTAIISYLIKEKKRKKISSKS